MGPIISVFAGLVCAEIIWALLLRAVLPIIPARFRSRLWRWAIALAIVYALMMIIVILSLLSQS